MTAAEVFESVTNGGSKDFSALVRILNANQPWCLIGGLAVNCYVETIYTIDADIVVMTGRLEQAGFQIQKFEHSINAKGRQSQLRIQFTTDVRYQEFLSDKKEHEVLGQRVPVASLDNVIRGKILAWKDQTWRTSKRKKESWTCFGSSKLYPKLREKIPPEIVEQLK
jgi:hypothetical protein